MNDNKHHIKQYSAADIQRYLKGELSAAEMHAMERAALEDPFLADAMEGMKQTIETYGSDLIDHDLRELKVALEEKAGSEARPLVPVRSLRWWKAAAAAVILIAAGALAYNSFLAPDREIAMVVHNQQTAPAPATKATEELILPDISTADSMVSEHHVPPALATAKQEATKKQFPSAQNNAPLALQETSTDQRSTGDTIQHVNARKLSATQANAEQAKTANAIVQERKDLRNKEELADDKAATEVVRAPDTDLARQRAANNANWADPALHNVIKGRVTDQFNRPLPNAFLINEQTRMNFTTDRNGFFNIPAKDSAIDVSISANGFATQRMQLQNNNPASNTIQLQPAMGYGPGAVHSAYEKKSSNPKMGTAGNGYRSIMVQDAEPVYGWVGYEQYLDKNKQVPQSAPDLHGDVVVTFIVNKKGELSAFKIAQSLSAAHDAEAIRLIKAGPSWKLIKGRRAKTTVIIQF